VGQPIARALPPDRQAGQSEAHALRRDPERLGLPQILREQRGRPDGRAIAQRPWILAETGTEHRINPRLSPLGSTAARTISQAFSHRQRLPLLAVLDPVDHSMARDVEALRHAGQTFPLIEPEQGLGTAEFLGLRRVCRDRYS
jgi:hypothetical protein